MAPLLINQRGLIKLGFITIFITAFVFVGGFFFGYEKAETHYLASSESKPLSLPLKQPVLVAEVKQQKPDVVDAGEVMDVDQPAIKVENQASLPVKEEVVLEVAKAPASEEMEVMTDNKIQHDDSKEVLVSNEVERTDARYSVQVGMYGSLANAEVVARKLREQGLTAYVSDYINKKKQVRFNVRFGYFGSKKSGNIALNKYIEDKKGDGYLVNYTSDKLIYLTEKNAKVEDVIPAKLEQVSVEPKSAILSDKVDDVLIKTQVEDSEKSLLNKTDKVIYN